MLEINTQHKKMNNKFVTATPGIKVEVRLSRGMNVPLPYIKLRPELLMPYHHAVWLTQKMFHHQPSIWNALQKYISALKKETSLKKSG